MNVFHITIHGIYPAPIYTTDYSNSMYTSWLWVRAMYEWMCEVFVYHEWMSGSRWCVWVVYVVILNLYLYPCIYDV